MPILVAPTAMQKMAHPEGENCHSYTADEGREYRSIGAVTVAGLDNTFLIGVVPHMCLLQSRPSVKEGDGMNATYEAEARRKEVCVQKIPRRFLA